MFKNAWIDYFFNNHLKYEESIICLLDTTTPMTSYELWVGGRFEEAKEYKERSLVETFDLNNKIDLCRASLLLDLSEKQLLQQIAS